MRAEITGIAARIPIRRTPREAWPPLSHAVFAYARARQISFIADANADFRDGFASIPMSNSASSRASSAICYLDATVRARKNLSIEGGATVGKVVFEGRQAVGVTVFDGNRERTIRGSEIVLSAGAIHSAKLLMLSGIGPAGALRALGVSVLADRPGVGDNLQNHAILYFGAHLRPSARQASSLRPHPTTGFRYSSCIAGGLTSDMYMNVHSKSSWSALGRQIANVSPILLRPHSRGTVRLKSSNPHDAPDVDFNLLADVSDLKRMTDGAIRAVDILLDPGVRCLYGKAFPVQMTDRLRRLNQKRPSNALVAGAVASLLDAVPALEGVVFGMLTSSKFGLRDLVADPAGLEAYVRDNVGGMFHIAGTCRMGGAADALAVVDPSGKVHDVARLRVVDASVMPTVPRGNTNIPTVMVAERMADLILKSQPLLSD